MPSGPTSAFGYPVVPALYIVGAGAVLIVLFTYRTSTTWPGCSSCCSACPIYFLWHGQR